MLWLLTLNKLLSLGIIYFWFTQKRSFNHVTIFNYPRKFWYQWQWKSFEDNFPLKFGINFLYVIIMTIYKQKNIWPNIHEKLLLRAATGKQVLMKVAGLISFTSVTKFESATLKRQTYKSENLWWVLEELVKKI